MGFFKQTEEEKAARRAKYEERKAKINEKADARLAKIDGWSRDANWTSVRLNASQFKVKIEKDGTVIDPSDRRNTGSIVGAKASVNTEGEIRDRFTATRILALGVFALAFKKKTSDKDVFMVIEHEDYTIVSEPIKSSKEQAARKWARDFNTAAADIEEFGLPE